MLLLMNKLTNDSNYPLVIRVDSYSNGRQRSGELEVLDTC